MSIPTIPTGVEDKVEIDAGTDPLCPQGKVCGTSLPTDNLTVQQSLDVKANAVGAFDITGQGFDSGAEEDILKIFSDSNPELSQILTDPEQLRTLLIQSGVIQQKDLVGIDDAALIELTKQVLQKQKTAETSQQNQ